MRPVFIIFMSIVIFLTTACTAPIPPITPSVPAGNSTITVNNAPTLVELAEFSEGEMGLVTALAFTPGNTQLRVVHTHATPMLRHWELSGGELLAEYDLETVGIGAAIFDGTAHLLALSGASSKHSSSPEYTMGIYPRQLLGPCDGIQIIDAENGQLLNQFPDPTKNQFAFFGVAFSQNGHVVASEEAFLKYQIDLGSHARNLYVFEMAEDRSVPPSLLFSTGHSYSDAETAFALDVEGRLFAVYADNGLIQLWDLELQQEWGELELNVSSSDLTTVNLMTIAPTRQWLAVATFSNIILWRLDERQVQWDAEIDWYIEAFAFNPSGTLLATGSSDGVRIWNAETGEEVKAFPGQSVYAIAFSQDGSLLAWGNDVGIVHLVGLPED